MSHAARGVSVVSRYVHAASSENVVKTKRNKKIWFKQRTEGERPEETQ